MKKKILFIIKTILVSFVLWVTTSSAVELISIRREINDFISQGVYQEDISTSFDKYYAIYDEQETNEAFTIKDNIYYPGVMGDIIIGLESPFPESIFNPLLTFYIGGHAALCTGEFKDHNHHILESDCVEATGDQTLNDGNAISCDRGYWLDNSYRKEAIGIRVKCTTKDKEKALNYAVSYVNDPYNYSFLFNTNNTKYCTDIITQAYKNVGVNLNKDRFAVTVMDVAFNSNTYIFYYKIADSKGINHIYYRTNKI